MPLSEHVLQAVRESAFFAGLPEPDLVLVAAACAAVALGPGEPLFSAGEEATGLFIVGAGRVRVYVASPDGREHTLGTMGPGQAVGEVALFAGRSYPANAMAECPTRCIFVGRAEFLRLVAAKPELALSVIGTLAERLRRFAARLEAISLKDAPSRLAAYLVAQAATGESSAVLLGLRKRELAHELGMAPETLSRAFARLSAHGAIRVEGGQVLLLRPEALAELASV